MTVNHASTLRKDYFLAYLRLVLNSRNCTLERARDLTIALFFRNNPKQYGDQTYCHFLKAYEELAMTKS